MYVWQDGPDDKWNAQIQTSDPPAETEFLTFRIHTKANKAGHLPCAVCKSKFNVELNVLTVNTKELFLPLKHMASGEMK